LIPVAVIRPQPRCDATVEAARALGFDAYGFPLFDVRPIAWKAPPPNAFDALLLGSANALRHAGSKLAAYAGKPTYAVGAATAEAAAAAGLAVVATGTGGLKLVLAMLQPEHRRLLRLSGRERITIKPPRGVSIQERVVYASEPLPLPPELKVMLARPAVVLLHSAEAAHHFADLCAAEHLARGHLSIAALGPRIARAAGGGWRRVEAAMTPNDTALLALIRRMCQDPQG
jgi:uroporphyrinogen-III synthase